MRTEGERFRLAMAAAILMLALPVFMAVAATSSRSSSAVTGANTSLTKAKTAIAEEVR
jgi:hypothetical protein